MNGEKAKLKSTKKYTPKKKIIEKLRLKYPRLEIDAEHWKSIPPEEEKHHPTKDDRFKRYRSTWSLINNGYLEYNRAPFYILYGDCLDQVIYRSLKAIYGLPDPLTIDVWKEDISEDGDIQATGKPIEWRYLLKGEEGSCFEILSTDKDTHPYIILWLPVKERPEKLSDTVSNGLNEFLTLFYELVEIVDNEFSIKEERKHIRKLFGDSVADLVTNLYYKNIQAGKEMMKIADEWVTEVEDSHNFLKGEGKWLDALDSYSKKSIMHISSVIFFIMSLEGFINLLYKFLLKPQFNREEYERSIWRSDLDLRILHLPVYCKGFSEAEITPDDSVYKLWLDIRPLRNNLLHSNITDENISVTTFEDYFLFFYTPEMHIKGKKKKKLTAQQLHMRKTTPLEVEKKVEEIVLGLIEKMDAKEKAYVKSWINLMLIPWYPGIEDKGSEWEELKHKIVRGRR